MNLEEDETLPKIGKIPSYYQKKGNKIGTPDCIFQQKLGKTREVSKTKILIHGLSLHYQPGKLRECHVDSLTEGFCIFKLFQHL